MALIKIQEICSIAMTEEQGMQVSRAMAPFMENDEPVTLDFSDLSLFATMFFNASIGYYVLQKGFEYCIQNIKLINLSNLGLETYEHSLSNAKEISETLGNYSANNVRIVEANIEES